MEKTSVANLESFYQNHGIVNFIYPKSLQALVSLDSIDKTTVPQNTVFDENGLEILHFNEKLCANHTLTFLKEYQKSMPLKLGKLSINEYLKHFKASDSSINFAAIQNQKKIRIFVNSASYANKYGVNQEAFEIYNRFKDQYTVIVVNFDKLKEWEATETK
ncbi:hypothetical protein CHX27_08535 [Flavobacterium aurantiibacter]|uniref:Uncharacterized protein n=1 Tax=Flavobacterium aurantiibacter TaxID=2023067 RepID=A0A255ZRA0_9FLAO|nr:hypothetical protein CHX27_08535 [Flavobacterium aurantiibacter]